MNRRIDPKVRHCEMCGVPIDKCMGFVKAGDWLDLIDGKVEASQVRELCGLCVNKVYPIESCVDDKTG